MMHKEQPSRTYKSLWLVVLVLLLGLSVLSASANVVISRFEAAAQTDGSILVIWETSTELDTQGFNLYRAASVIGPWTDRVDQQVSLGDGFTGATYEYRDADVEPDMRYYYLLEELTSSGPGKRFGPVNAGINLEPEPTATNTATATPTVTATAAPTSTPTQAAGSSDAVSATATRQFANSPVPPATATPGKGIVPTPAAGATATPLPAAQIATPTPAGGFIAAPTATQPASTQAQATAVATPRQEPPAATATVVTAEPRSGDDTQPAATTTPQIFAAATADSPLLETTGRVTPQPAPPAGTGRDRRLILVLGGAAIGLAGVLALAGWLIWRASRLR